MTTERMTIEYPAIGATYAYREYGVYRYGTYENSSVMAGQEKRSFVSRFDTLKEARDTYPNAEVIDGTLYREVHIPHASPAWFSEDDAGETWDDEDY